MDTHLGAARILRLSTDNLAAPPSDSAASIVRGLRRLGQELDQALSEIDAAAFGQQQQQLQAWIDSGKPEGQEPEHGMAHDVELRISVFYTGFLNAMRELNETSPAHYRSLLQNLHRWHEINQDALRGSLTEFCTPGSFERWQGYYATLRGERGPWTGYERPDKIAVFIAEKLAGVSARIVELFPDAADPAVLGSAMLLTLCERIEVEMPAQEPLDLDITPRARGLRR